MKINTCYTSELKAQLEIGRDGAIVKAYKVNARLMDTTNRICLDALEYCVNTFLKEWDYLLMFPSSSRKGVTHRKRVADLLIHSTKDSTARYEEFDKLFPYMPSYTRRSIIAKALGMASSYKSNYKNWEWEDPATRGSEPTIGFPAWYGLTFYEQERDMGRLAEGIIALKLYDGTSWGWYDFKISPSDARYIHSLTKTRKLLFPTVTKVRGEYRIQFCFEEKKDLVDPDPLKHTVLAVDLWINAAASWCVMSPDGTVHARGVIHLPCDEDCLRRLMNRKKMYQRAGKKSRSIYRFIKNANGQLSINTAKRIMDTAVLYSVDCIVFEHLEKGGRFAERIHMWRANDIQSRVENQAHRHGMRISRVCAWNTSKLAFDGSGVTDRKSVYRYAHGEKKIQLQPVYVPKREAVQLRHQRGPEHRGEVFPPGIRKAGRCYRRQRRTAHAQYAVRRYQYNV